MKPGKILNIKVVNILIACMISLFVIFPDITLLNSTRTERTPVQKEYSSENSPPPQHRLGQKPPLRQHPEHRPPKLENNKLFHVFPYDTVDKVIVNYVFFFVLAIVLLFLNTYNLLYNRERAKKKDLLAVSIAESFVICILFIILYTFIDHRKSFMPLDGMNVFKCFFIGIISFLFIYIVRLINQQQQMSIENERLRNENLLAQYNMLSAQVNPHFLFNSLNSLSSLVRENENEKSVKYINELSDIFRYVLKANGQGLTTLKEELDFLHAYRYMLEIRYEGKLSFDIRVDGKYMGYQLPVLSIQLLIENVIKHNEISEDKPLRVDIYTTEDDMLVISNPIHKRLVYKSNSGIGLHNLNNRYQLLVSQCIIIEDKDDNFTVKLPLTNNTDE